MSNARDKVNDALGETQRSAFDWHLTSQPMAVALFLMLGHISASVGRLTEAVEAASKKGGE